MGKQELPIPVRCGKYLYLYYSTECCQADARAAPVYDATGGLPWLLSHSFYHVTTQSLVYGIRATMHYAVGAFLYGFLPWSGCVIAFSEHVSVSDYRWPRWRSLNTPRAPRTVCTPSTTPPPVLPWWGTISGDTSKWTLPLCSCCSSLR